MHLQNQLIVVIQSRGKYSTSIPGNGARNVGDQKSLLDCLQEQSLTPISLISRFFKGVIKWRKTQNDIVSTQKLGQACMDE